MEKLNSSDMKYTDNSIVLFDGICNLCQASVRFIIRRDPHAKFRFASLQSDVARRLLRTTSYPTDQSQSLILIENGRIFTRSTAALRICKKLHRAWPLLYPLIILPRPLRDHIYRWIAKNRYRWFGKSEQCMLPSPEMKSRFLD